MPSHDPHPQRSSVEWPMRAAIDIAHDEVADVGVVELRGEHDISTQVAVTHALEKAGAETSGVVDLSHCAFIDSSVLHVLMNVALVLQARGDQLVVVIARGRLQIERVAALTGLAVSVPLHTSRAAALAGLAHSMQAAVHAGPSQ